jgi:serine/threonine protein kinase
MEMYKKGTLHRDISILNVLLGKPGAEPGFRGVLIDFDVATHRAVKTIRPEDWLIVSTVAPSSLPDCLNDVPRAPDFINR